MGRVIPFAAGAGFHAGLAFASIIEGYSLSVGVNLTLLALCAAAAVVLESSRVADGDDEATDG